MAPFAAPLPQVRFRPFGSAQSRAKLFDNESRAGKQLFEFLE